MFSPASRVDAELIKSLLLTMVWGGACGERPAFLVRALQQHGDGGQGVGKSTFVEVLAKLRTAVHWKLGLEKVSSRSRRVFCRQRGHVCELSASTTFTQSVFDGPTSNRSLPLR